MAAISMSARRIYTAYRAEFDFGHNNGIRLGIDDAMRAHRILKGAEGKRLTYRQVA